MYLRVTISFTTSGIPTAALFAAPDKLPLAVFTTVTAVEPVFGMTLACQEDMPPKASKLADVALGPVHVRFPFTGPECVSCNEVADTAIEGRDVGSSAFAFTAVQLHCPVPSANVFP